ncbi:hypothetical protein G7Y89_g3032 [Cudoniella acicularis]|uniref:Uncharacterized protein n=1 Tax=Cudoniella acicularis TaxID=354080 RepID=A0A8H4W823_9HELO|nr:hypothetical protein G7Y89_g3032 [Cudoniella acicularis]
MPNTRVCMDYKFFAPSTKPTTLYRFEKNVSQSSNTPFSLSLTSYQSGRTSSAFVEVVARAREASWPANTAPVRQLLALTFRLIGLVAGHVENLALRKVELAIAFREEVWGDGVVLWRGESDRSLGFEFASHCVDEDVNLRRVLNIGKRHQPLSCAKLGSSINAITTIEIPHPRISRHISPLATHDVRISSAERVPTGLRSRLPMFATAATRSSSEIPNLQPNATAKASAYYKNTKLVHPVVESLSIFCDDGYALVCNPWVSKTMANHFNSIVAGGGFLIYTNYFYHSYIIGAFHKFPEPVAKQMRKALYYTNYSLEPKLAVKYYREALRVADEIGMDPFSDEIIGVKIQLAALMEKIQLYQKAIDILEIVKSDNLKWMEALGDKLGNGGKRTRVLGMTVRVSVKLGDLYANEYVLEKDKAEECLVWAVETVLREQQRRDKEGVKPGEGNWISAEEQGGALETLAYHYEEKNHHYLAAPLFLQAITYSQPSSCHTAVLMNNLSISLAQQVPPPTPGQPAASRSEYVNNARAWAEKAIAVAAKITPPTRTEECDVGCAVATHNLGEFAEMDGNIAEARKRFEEAKSLAKAIGFQDGVINSENALRRIGKS